MEQGNLVPSSGNYRQQLDALKGQLLQQMDVLEREDTTESEKKAAQAVIHAALKRLKQERDQMVGHLADETLLLDEMETRLREIERVNKKGFRILPPAPTNAQIDYQEKKTKHFAQGRSAYKLFWVFFIGCFLGVMVERTWCMVRYGHYEPRVGLIYGPFNLVYGLGALVMTMVLYSLRNRSGIFSFFGGAIAGSAVEYFCSWFQEMAFGSVSWDYSDTPFNLNGRICLLYAAYWGVLGVMWIKNFYPRLAQLILKIPNRIGRPLTVVLALFMLVNILMTGLTTLRWMNRRQGEPPRNVLEVYIDEHYPDERMAAILENLVFNDERDAKMEDAADFSEKRDEKQKMERPV